MAAWRVPGPGGEAGVQEALVPAHGATRPGEAPSCPVGCFLFSTFLGKGSSLKSTNQKKVALFSHGHWASESNSRPNRSRTKNLRQRSVRFLGQGQGNPEFGLHRCDKNPWKRFWKSLPLVVSHHPPCSHLMQVFRGRDHKLSLYVARTCVVDSSNIGL